MARTPFKMRSGNSTPFKQMGSSPMRAVVKTHSRQEDAPEVKKQSVKPGKKSGDTLSYSEAYKKADKSKYKTEAEFTKAAKAWNIKKYGTEEPTKESKKLIGKHEGSMTTSPKVTKETAKRELAKKHKAKKVEATKLETSKKSIETGLATGKLKKKGEGVEVVRPTVKSKRKVSVKEAKGRGKERVKATRKTFGRWSSEVKAAKKIKTSKVKAARKSRRAKRREERKSK